jgi:poly-gamma-glutamate capsule biosynthesis protein CapA/YwtB (metallophosphatase superfamily)
MVSANDGFLSPGWIEPDVPDGFTVASVGDLVMTTPIFERLKRIAPRLVELLLDADVTFGNFEGSILDLANFDGYPAALSGGGWLLSSPPVAADLKRMGFDLLSHANNHATDYGVQGLLSTSRFLDQAGIVNGGSGKTLSQAREARLLSVPAGRVALIAVTAHYEADSPASDPFGPFAGRPGVSTLRTTRYAMVSPEDLAAIQKIREALPAGSELHLASAAAAKTDAVSLFGAHYKVRSTAKAEVSFSFLMNEHDHGEIIRAIRQGKQISDYAIASIHTHEPGNYATEPPDFLEILAHDAVDNGADAVVMHGPHQLRGIEIYKGKPIFYSLGNFFFMVSTWSPIVREMYEWARIEPGSMTDAEFRAKRRAQGVFNYSECFESVVATSRFERGRVSEIRLYPVDLHWEAARDADRGIPRLASPSIGTRILEWLQDLSRPYGTRICIENGVGVIRVPEHRAPCPTAAMTIGRRPNPLHAPTTFSP